MTTYIILVLLLLLVGAAVFRPLLSPEFDSPTGPGLETRPGPSLAEAEAMADNEAKGLRAALAEGKISEEDLTEEVGRIHKAASASDYAGRGLEAGAPSRRPSTYPLGAVLGWGSAVALSLAAAIAVERLDIVRTDAQSVSDRASMADARAPGVPPVPDDFVPDIGAMVGQLEARILSGDVVEQDIEMLMRSYTVLGREEELAEFLRSAIELNSEHPVLLLALGILLYEDQDAESDREAEALFDRMIESEPDHPVAQWYKSLVLARKGEVALAVVRLRLVQELVAADPRASSVVADLIERLTSPDEAVQTPESEAQ